MVKGLKMEEPPDALLPAEGGALEARVRKCSSAHAVHLQCICSAHVVHGPYTAVHMQMQGALFTTLLLVLSRWAALLTTYHFHLPLTTYHLPPTTYHLPPTTHHPPPTTYH